MSAPTCAHALAGTVSRGCPRTLTEPRCGRSIPSDSRISVVFPAPFSPIRATISPGSIVNVRSLTPTPPGNTRLTFLNVMMSVTPQQIESLSERGIQ